MTESTPTEKIATILERTAHLVSSSNANGVRIENLDKKVDVKVEEVALRIDKKIEGIHEKIEKLEKSVVAELKAHEAEDDRKFLTRREGGMISATLVAIATLFAIFGYIWVK